MLGARLGVVLLLAGCVEPSVGRGQQPVIGGTLTPEGMYPATGALVLNDGYGYQPTCTGTLIAPDAVLTAGHCVDDLFTNGAVPSFTLALNANGVSADQVYAGLSSHPHPSFDINTLPTGIGRWYDIAVLKLAQPVPDAAVEILPTVEEAALLAPDLMLQLVGYGLTSNDTFDLGVKYHGEGRLREVAEAELLISDPGTQQNCNGDSGGPALVDLGEGLRIVGVVSRSPDDNPVCDHGGVDTRTDSYLDFIHGLVDVECGGLADPCPCSGPNCPSGGCQAGAAGSGGAAGLILVAGALLIAIRRRRG